MNCPLQKRAALIWTYWIFVVAYYPELLWLSWPSGMHTYLRHQHHHHHYHHHHNLTIVLSKARPWEMHRCHWKSRMAQGIWSFVTTKHHDHRQHHHHITIITSTTTTPTTPTTVIKFMSHPCRRRVGPDLDCRPEVKAISVKHYEYEDQKKKIVK